MRLIFYDRLKYRPFANLLKFLYLVQFPVSHLSHPVMSTLVFLLCQFKTFAYYVINCFISVTTKPTLAIINFCFDIICSYEIFLCYYYKRLSFLF